MKRDVYEIITKPIFYDSSLFIGFEQTRNANRKESFEKNYIKEPKKPYREKVDEDLKYYK